MRVLLHDAGASFYTRSGIGQAVRQQAEALARVGATRVRSLRENPHVVQLNFATPASLLLARRARAAGIPVLWFAHSTMEDARGSVMFSDQLAPLYWRFLRASYRSGDLVLTPTAYSKRLLEGHGVDRPVEVLSNGVDTAVFSPAQGAERDRVRARVRGELGLAEDATVVVSVGHWFRRKGMVDMIEVARRCPQVQVVWFGHTDPRLVQADVREALGSAPANFHTPGYVDRARIRDAYRAADLFALASTEETEGIVVLEALATGVPVVVRDIPVFDGWLTGNIAADATSTGTTSTAPCHVARDVEGFAAVVEQVRAGTLEDRTAAGHRVARDRDLRAIAARMPALWRRAFDLSRGAV